MSDDQRAMLDSCTNSPTCRGDFHLLCCPSTSRRPDPDPQPEPEPGPEVQRWERRQVGVDLGLHLEVDGQGRVTVHEAVLAQLLVDAGWERTA